MPHPGSSSDQPQGQAQSSWGLSWPRSGPAFPTLTQPPTRVQGDGVGGQDRGEWPNSSGLGESRAEVSGFRAAALTAGPPDLLSPPTTLETPNQLQASAPQIKYTDTFILSKGPQSGEGAPGRLGPPSQPRPEVGLKSSKSCSQPCRNLPKSSLPTPAECSFRVSPFCYSGVCSQGVGSLPAGAPGPGASERMVFFQSS